jgi:adenylosuccinate synthase
MIRFDLTKRLAITKLDVLDQLPELKIAIAYKYNGQVLDSFPGI